ncbi:MAG TPA: hypothetical protein RMH85_22730 [Polyangiaceae bacterium LLY-WYZ-15_(1-7)]|nr:hypothetical protein [Myxococcales bacterium]MAT27563.1 hypothetical protein [Sandaracinus sp.]HJK89186.1 hypothetical protein [Polyangiaceae bacterium LLY-WYZ-15_(1-7)]MBJ74125.1 hypothetical protein [Sandaracinus sp.]HJL06379.1 hypothetical protein [Polyangiaceae bacterium LLY-WYZ-15_(1-7)]
MDLAAMRAAARLGRWLGPWTPEDAVPHRVHRRAVPVPPRAPGERPFEAWVYRPLDRPPTGALLVVPGLHYLGPADPRLDRFCRVLADAGILVLCPFLPDFSTMRVEPTLGPDAERAFDALLGLPELPRRRRPGVFSISFGCYPAIQLAARREEVGQLMLFGGYADFRDTLRFCVGGDGERAHDPLNMCVVFLNLLEHLEVKDPGALTEAWLEYVRRTWGRPHMKAPEAHAPLARALAARLPDRDLFLETTGVEGDAPALLESLLPPAAERIARLETLRFAPEVRCPAVVAHGRDDDVIPWEHAERLAGALPNARRYVTGMYAHTGQSGLRELLPQARDEARAMLGILGAMAGAAHQP